MEKAKIEKIVDVWLNNVSQLAGFTKIKDLKFFLEKILRVEYIHEPELASSKELINGFKKGEISWDKYRTRF